MTLDTPATSFPLGLNASEETSRKVVDLILEGDSDVRQVVLDEIAEARRDGMHEGADNLQALVDKADRLLAQGRDARVFQRHEPRESAMSMTR